MTPDEAWQFWLAQRAGGRYLRWETVREAFLAGVAFGRASAIDSAAAAHRTHQDAGVTVVGERP